MASISGRVLFTSTSASTGGTGVANIPVVLQNTTTNVGMTVLTDATGTFIFNNVPNASYRLVEAYGTTGGVTGGTGDFNSAAVMTAPTPRDPDVSAITSPPANTDKITSLSPNTIFLTMTGTNITGQDFRDNPQRNIPLTVNDMTLVATNLVTAANAGSWGSNPVGTAKNTYPATTPYGTVVTGFTYTTYGTNSPPDGNYALVNLAVGDVYSWWNMPDRTTGDETGRYIIVNGSTPGAIIFTETYNSVKQNTFYMLSIWISNLNKSGTNGLLPSLGVRVKTTGGTQIFNKTLTDIAEPAIPTWNQVSTVLNTQSNTAIILEIYSNGNAGGGNDYAIDDILFQECTVNSNLITNSQVADKNYSYIGDTITYTSVIKNNGNSTTNNITVSDTIPSGTSFVTGSVTVNGTTIAAATIGGTGYNTGQSLNAGGTLTVTYKVRVNSIPTNNSFNNSAVTKFDFLPVAGGATVTPTVYSSLVSTQVYTPIIAMTKSVDKNYADIGETLSYTVSLNNTGSTSANNTIFIDTIPSNSTFISNSFYINGIQGLGANPNNGYNIGTVPIGLTTINFQVSVNTIPSTNNISNSASITYTYTVDPSLPNSMSSGVSSSVINTRINSVLLNSTKYVDKDFADVGETVTYTISLNNTGNVSANNVILKDTIPNNSNFITNSLLVNNITQTGANPNSGYNIGTVAVGLTTVTFKVAANTLPSTNYITNTASMTYTYTVDPSIPRIISTGINTNTTSTKINTVYFDTTNIADKNYVTVGDIVTYTINFINRGDVSANNVIVMDTMPSGLVFVTDSLIFNGVTQTGSSILPSNGFYIGNINAGDSNTISFKALVSTIPTPNIFKNDFGISFRHLVAPTSWPVSKFSFNNYSNVTTINSPYFGTSSKLVNKSFATVTDELTYTIVLRNTGNTAATSVNFIDTIPNGLTFKLGTVNIDGTNYSSFVPNSPGFSYPASINSGATSTVSFIVTVTTIPTTNMAINSTYISYNCTADPLLPNLSMGNYTTNSIKTNLNQYSFSNSLVVNYQYTPDPTVPSDVNGSINSNSVVSTVSYISLKNTQTVDRAYSDIGETLTYTIVYNNTGSTSANSVIISTIPSGVSLLANSISINGINQINTASITTISLSSIPVGVTTIVYKVKVDTIPTINPIQSTMNTSYSYTVFPTLPNGYSGYSAGGNSTSSKINTVFLYGRKSVDRSYGNLGDILTYTIPITNTGNITANNAVVKDTIPDGISLVANSLAINGVIQGSGNPSSGFNMGTLPIGVTTLSFKVIVNSIPSINPIANVAAITYNYTVDPSVPNAYASGIGTNTVNTTINAAILSSTKTADKYYANYGDTITYTIPIKNTGNASATSSKIIDTIPSGATFITNSLLVNGVTQSGTTPNAGYVIGTIAAGTVTTIQFKVTVNTIPTLTQILNSAALTYKYTVDPSIVNGASSAYNTNSTITELKNANLGNATKTVSNSYADANDILTYTIAIPNTGNMDATNVIVSDTIPVGTTFVQNSLTVNGVQTAEMPTMINIGTIPVGNSATITFKVQISS